MIREEARPGSALEIILRNRLEIEAHNELESSVLFYLDACLEYCLLENGVDSRPNVFAWTLTINTPSA